MHRATLAMEHIMATQTRRTIRRAARFFRTTVTASLVTACCGLVLWSAVAAYAEASRNGLPINGMPLNGARQQDGATAAGHSASAAPGVATPSTTPPAAGSPIQIALADPT